MDYRKKKRGALALANKVREWMGLPAVDHLYPGTIVDAYHCAITETVYDDDLDRDKYRICTTYDGVLVYRLARRRDMPFQNAKEIKKFRHTPESKEFIMSFDRGLFRSLIK